MGDQICIELHESERLLWLSRRREGWLAQVQDGAVFLGDVPVDMAAICWFSLQEERELEFASERYVLRLYWRERIAFVELSGERTITEQIDWISMLEGIASL